MSSLLRGYHDSSSADLDCTSLCMLPSHARRSHCCIVLGDLQLVSKLREICGNPYKGVDEYGRNSLHIAASLGCADIVDWLLEEEPSLIGSQDSESLWTSLHRAFYFGHIDIAVALLKKGAMLSDLDRGHSSPLDLVSHDLYHLVCTRPSDEDFIFSTWGENLNASIGHEHSRSVPERLNGFHNEKVVQVVLCKFHSVFLTASGSVYTSGVGRGGRLGHGNEYTLMVPTAVEGLSGIVEIGAARDHCVFLDKRGNVYTCGLNGAHQLGHGQKPPTAPDSLLKPKVIKSKYRMIHVGAGRFHTAMCSKLSLYTFGEDHGQLGYKAKYETQIVPHEVPLILEENEEIVCLSVSDAATACLTTRKRIFLCYDRSVKIITLANQFIKPDFTFKQFIVCATLGDYEKKSKILMSPVVILMLDSHKEVWKWTIDMKTCKRIIVSGIGEAKVRHIYLGKNIFIVTEYGELFKLCEKELPENAKQEKSEELGSIPVIHFKKFISVQNGVHFAADFKGTNFALLQRFYRLKAYRELNLVRTWDEDTGVFSFFFCSTVPYITCSSPTEKPPPEQSTYREDMIQLKQNEDFFRDVVLESEFASIACHKFILGSRSSPLKAVFDSSNKETYNVEDIFSVGNVSESCLDLFVSYAYTLDYKPVVAVHRKEKSEDRALSPDGQPSILGTPPSSPVTGGELFAFARQGDFTLFGKLVKASQVADLSEHKLGATRHGRMFIPLPKLSKLNYKELCFTNFYIESLNGERIYCHNYILAARAEFFRCMLTMGWKESYEQCFVRLPYSSTTIHLVLEYLYTDEVRSLEKLSFNDLLDLYIVSDQLLIHRLGDLCQLELIKLVTIRQATEMAEFALMYNASHLLNYCLSFICYNLPYIIGASLYEGMSSGTLRNLAKVYQQLVPATARRVIHVTSPEDTEFLNALYDIPQDTIDPHQSPKSPPTLQEPSKQKSLISGTGSTKKRKKRRSSKSIANTEPKVEEYKKVSLKVSHELTNDNSNINTSANNDSHLRLHEDERQSHLSMEASEAAEKENVNEPVLPSELISPAKVFNNSNSIPVAQKAASPKHQWDSLPNPSPSDFRQILKDQRNMSQKETKPALANPNKSKSKKKLPSTPGSKASSKTKPTQIVKPGSGHPKGSPWGDMATSPPALSLSDVMAEEERLMEKRNTSCPTQVTAQPRQAKESKFKTHTWGIPTSSTIKDSDQQSMPTSFADVIIDQQLQKDCKQQVKAMEDIEMEEFAIQQLEALYDAKDNPDEWIAVVREDCNSSVPSWCQIIAL